MKPKTQQGLMDPTPLRMSVYTGREALLTKNSEEEYIEGMVRPDPAQFMKRGLFRLENSAKPSWGEQQAWD